MKRLTDGLHAAGSDACARCRRCGRFNSIWRQDAPGVWRVSFDKGSPAEPHDVQ